MSELLGLEVFVASAEDVILAKLAWARISDSERQIRDAAGVLRTNGDAIDENYLWTWVRKLDVRHEWQAAKRAAGGAPDV